MEWFYTYINNELQAGAAINDNQSIYILRGC